MVLTAVMRRLEKPWPCKRKIPQPPRNGKDTNISSRHFSGVPKYCRPGLRCMLKGGVPESLSFRVMDCEALPSMP